ncbi:cupredoxin domain-containing protein [Candidatus Woesearchaeota archaeon]|nr:cupredoxin domain-containing protein [Candidatus Woesearchaeota archaeon]
MKVFLAVVLVVLLAAGCNQVVESQPAASVEQPSGQPSSSVREIPVRVFRFGFDPETITVRKGERVRLIFTSSDVRHGFSVAEYGIDVVVPAGGSVPYEFVADKPGSFVAYCSVYCGSGHAEMKGRLVVE